MSLNLEVFGRAHCVRLSDVGPSWRTEQWGQADPLLWTTQSVLSSYSQSDTLCRVEGGCLHCFK